MIWDDFLESHLVVLLGVPGSGQREVADQLYSVGLVDQITHSSTLIEPTTTGHAQRVVDMDTHLDSLVQANRRSVLIVEFDSIDHYEQLLDQLGSLRDEVYLVVMDAPIAGVLVRSAGSGASELSPTELEELHQRLFSLDIERLGLPFMMSSSLLIAIEGQDDW